MLDVKRAVSLLLAAISVSFLGGCGRTSLRPAGEQSSKAPRCNADGGSTQDRSSPSVLCFQSETFYLSCTEVPSDSLGEPVGGVTRPRSADRIEPVTARSIKGETKAIAAQGVAGSCEQSLHDVWLFGLSSSLDTGEAEDLVSRVRGG